MFPSFRHHIITILGLNTTFILPFGLNTTTQFKHHNLVTLWFKHHTNLPSGLNTTSNKLPLHFKFLLGSNTTLSPQSFYVISLLALIQTLVIPFVRFKHQLYQVFLSLSVLVPRTMELWLPYLTIRTSRHEGPNPQRAP